MADIKVSIVVPVYNAEKTLRRCLDSLVGQTLNDIEIIVVDDISTDNGNAILELYKKAYFDKMRIVRLESKGGAGRAARPFR